MAAATTQAPAGASLSDILTAAKNLVTALNGASQNYLNIQGIANAYNLTTTTLIKGAPGRVASILVITGGAAGGAIYDSTLVAQTTKPIYIIPTTAGLYVVNMPANYGIVVAPSAGQAVTVSYS